MTRGVLSLSVRPAGVFDGVGDFSGSLAAALRAAGADVTTASRDALGTWARLPPPAGRAVLLHYVAQPFATPDIWPLGRWLRAARASGSLVIVVVHEYLPPRDTLRRRIAAAALGWNLRRLLRQATAAVVTHDLAKRELAELGFRPEAVVIPVGATIPVTRPAVPASGTGWVMFGQPASFDAGLVRAIGARRDAGIEAEVIWMTRSREEATAFCARAGVDPTAIDIRGGCRGEEVSRLMAGAAGALAPFVDGVSTRRTSAAAALAHALPIVGTDGSCTVDVLRRSPAMRLSRPSDATGFLAAFRDVASNPAERAAMSAAAADLDAAVFAWPGLAARYAALIEAA